MSAIQRYSRTAAVMAYDDDGAYVLYSDAMERERVLREALGKHAKWLEAQAARDERVARGCRFSSLREAYIADAKNYRAMAKEARAALEATND